MAMVFGDDDKPTAPPGTGPTYKFEGPWFTTQLTLSLSIGVSAFLIFSYCRRKWPVLFAPRTKLKGFSPHEAHAHQAFFGWIMPTIKTSEFTILQIVGLDAAVLLNFFKMSFYLFSTCAIMAGGVIMPINYYFNTDKEEDSDWDPNPPSLFDDKEKPPTKTPDWFDLVSDPNSYLALHLMFTYVFTLLALRSLYRNYQKFLRARQLYSLELVHSIPARTVMITNLPNHLRGERALAVYWENMGLAVESVSCCREPKSLDTLLENRTKALLELEKAWTSYVGNPSTVESYDPSLNVRADAHQGDTISLVDTESQPNRVVVPHRSRPTLWTKRVPNAGVFGKKVDALEFLDSEFKALDEAVRKKRKTTKFKATHVAFVTFEKMSSAQIASQTAHAPHHSESLTVAAPEPRDIVWANMNLAPATIRARELTVLGFMILLFFFWIIPVTGLASLLSYNEIKKVMPWLGRLIDSSDKVRAIVQNSLPSVAMASLMGLLPFILEGLCYLQGFKARSWIEYSLMKKYFLFLLINVVFIFLLASTYWQLVRDLAESPAKIPEKVAQALSTGKAKHFFLSYVILQGLGIMPLQLLNLGVIVPRLVYRAFITRTPRDFAELNAPPMINYGAVYPQAILIFVITLTYSVFQPVILFFGALYFGVAYVVYKYKLLFVFYKPYESQGQAWPLTFTRLVWGVLIFQVFMTGVFTLKGYLKLSSLMAPLIAFTLYWTWEMDRRFTPLSKYVALSSVFEVQRGEDTDDVVRIRAGHPVTWSQSNLNRRRYAQNDETLYVAPEDDRTDYSQPPMTNWYYGVLNTGKRRYGHPALTGVLPTPWLPLKKGQTLANYIDRDANGTNNGGKSPVGTDQAVVLTLRRRHSNLGRKSLPSPFNESAAATPIPNGAGSADVTPNKWDAVGAQPAASGAGVSMIKRPQRSTSRGEGRRSSTQVVNHRLSFDHASGVIMLPEDGADWLPAEDESSPEETEDGHAGDVVGGGDLYTTDESSDAEETIGRSRARGRGLGLEGIQDSPLATTPQNMTRRGTYYHHPERRRVVIPGAFPRSPGT